MWGEKERKVFEGGEGPNSESFYPIGLDMISDRMGGCRIFNYLPKITEFSCIVNFSALIRNAVHVL